MRGNDFIFTLSCRAKSIDRALQSEHPLRYETKHLKYSKSEPGLEAPLLHAPGAECGWTHLTTTMMPTSHFAPSHHIMANERCGRMDYFCSSYAYSSSVKRSRKIGTNGRARAEASAGETPTPPPSTSTLSAHVVACLSVCRYQYEPRLWNWKNCRVPFIVYGLWGSLASSSSIEDDDDGVEWSGPLRLRSVTSARCEVQSLQFNGDEENPTQLVRAKEIAHRAPNQRRSVPSRRLQLYHR